MSVRNQPNASKRIDRKHRRSWRNALVLMALLVVGAALVIGTRPWFMIAMIEPEVERMLGGRVEISHVRWISIGRMELSGVSVRVPNDASLPEPAGEVATIDRLNVNVRILPLLIGRLSPRKLEFDGVLLRLAENARDAGWFTFFALDPRMDVHARHGSRPPRIEVRNVTLESGEFDADRYIVIGRRRVAGSMHRMSGKDTTITFELAEIDDRGQVLEDGLRISGRWDTATFAHAARIDGLALDEQTLTMCPQIVRLWWEHMDLTGRVSEAKLEWTLGESFTVELAIEQVGMTLPEQVEAFLVRYHDGSIIEQTERPRMELHSGVIRWIDDGVELLDLQGRFLSGDMAEDEVVHLPYRISVSIDELHTWDFDRRDEWLAHALEIAPFHMSIETSMDVTQSQGMSMPGVSRAVDLPLPVARVLEQLQLADWSISTSVEIWREQALGGEGGALVASPIQWRGRLNIDDGSLSVEQFPYRLYDVDASIRIEQNTIHIEELHARGSQDSHFSGAGKIILPADMNAARGGMGFDIRLSAAHMSLDDAFLAALPEQNQRFFDSLFARPLYESLEHAGLLAASEDVDQLEARLIEIERLLDGAAFANPDAGESDASSALVTDRDLLVERDRLIAQIERGPIRLGGNFHFNLRIRREAGPSNPTELTGIVEPDAIGVIYDQFPYPFTVVGGKLEWSPGRISILGDDRSYGLAIILPSGGRGVISGHIDRPRIDGRRRIHPDLHFEIIDEPMNELLAAAIPMTEHDREHLPNAEEWPGTVFAAPARLLQGIGLEGTVGTTGRIYTTHQPRPAAGSDTDIIDKEQSSESSTRIAYHFDVHLSDGNAKPTIQLAEHIGAAGLFWPNEFAARNVQGHLTITEEQVHLLGFHGWHGQGQVFATGEIDRVAEPATIELDVTLSDLDLHESIINLVPQEGIETAQELWDRYQPRGRFTADLNFRETGDYRHPMTIVAHPTVCHVLIDGEPVMFAGLGGNITIVAGDDPVVGFEQLRVNIHHGEIDHGELLITGAYGVTGDQNPLHVNGEWTNAAIESPVILEMLRLLGAERHQQWFRDHSPTGRVDAEFDYESARTLLGGTDKDIDAVDRYWLSITPHEIAFMLDETPIRAMMHPGSHVKLTPGHVQFSDFAGHVGDSMFQVDGDVRIDGTIAAEIEIDFIGRIASDEVMALFPTPARSVLRDLEFDDGERTEVRGGRLQLHGKRPADPVSQAEAFDWSVEYVGQLHLHGAAIQIGVAATEINGTVDLSLDVTPHTTPRVMMAADFDSLRVIDRLITDVQVHDIRLSEDGTKVLIPEVRGNAYGGLVLAEATVGVGEQRTRANGSAKLDAEPSMLYELKVDLAGLVLSKLYADHIERLAAANGGAASGRQRAPQGEVFGSIKLAGQHGRPELRTGRGTIRAVGGNIENVPTVLHVFNVLHMTPPLRGKLDQANADFYIDGNHIFFENILFESTIAEQFAVFQLIGRGWMDLHTFEMNTQFRSRGGMLLLRDLAGGLGDQLYVIEVTGTPAEPKARLLPLPWLFQPFGPPADLGLAPTER